MTDDTDIRSLIRPHLLAMPGYEPVEPIDVMAARLGIKPEDIAKLADLQARLLASAARMVRPGGRLVFSNCSLDPAEGELLVGAFLAEHTDMVLDPIQPGEVPGADPFIASNGAIRTTPADLDLGRPEISGLDGFFAARFFRLP